MFFSSAIAGSLFTLLFAILRSYRIPYAWGWTLCIALGSTSFIYRLLLLRPFTIGIIGYVLGTWLLLRKQYIAVMIVTTIYILTYNLAIFLILPAIILILVRGIVEKSWSLKPIIAVLGGITLGLIIHPHTSSYILLIKAHLVDIYLLQLQGVPLPVGSEIVPQLTRTFFALHSIPILGYIISMILLLGNIYSPPQQLKVPIYTMALLSVIWFPIAIGVHRGIEYWYPMTMLTSILVLSLFITQLAHSIYKILTIVMLSIGCLIVSISTYILFFEQISSEAVQSYATVSEMQPFIPYIAQTEGTVWYPSWYLFPVVFYSLPIPVTQPFVGGFDPVFMYLYNDDMYFSWYKLSFEGIACLNKTTCPPSLSPSDVIHTLFDAELIISPKIEQTKLFRAAIEADTNIVRILENEMYILYRVIES